MCITLNNTDLSGVTNAGEDLILSQIERRDGSYHFSDYSPLAIPARYASHKLQTGFIHGDYLSMITKKIANDFLAKGLLLPDTIYQFFYQGAYQNIPITKLTEMFISIAPFLIQENYLGIKVLSISQVNSLLNRSHTHLSKQQLHNVVLSGKVSTQLGSELSFWYYLAGWAIIQLRSPLNTSNQPIINQTTTHKFLKTTPLHCKAVYSPDGFRPGRMHYEYMTEFKNALYQVFKSLGNMSNKTLYDFFETGFNAISNIRKIESALTVTLCLFDHNYMELKKFSITQFNDLANQYPNQIINQTVNQNLELARTKNRPGITSEGILWYQLAYWADQSLNQTYD